MGWEAQGFQVESNAIKWTRRVVNPKETMALRNMFEIDKGKNRIYRNLLNPPLLYIYINFDIVTSLIELRNVPFSRRVYNLCGFTDSKLTVNCADRLHCFGIPTQTFTSAWPDLHLIVIVDHHLCTIWTSSHSLTITAAGFFSPSEITHIHTCLLITQYTHCAYEKSIQHYSCFYIYLRGRSFPGAFGFNLGQ